MKAQGVYSRTILDAIAPRAALEQKIAAFTASFGFVQNYAYFGGRAFYEERAPGSDNFDLVVKDAKGMRKIIDVAALRAANGGKPYAINYFLASPDGSKVAAGVAKGGSEEARLAFMMRPPANKSPGPSIVRNSAPPVGASISRHSISFA